jgi:hypothetical protein
VEDLIAQFYPALGLPSISDLFSAMPRKTLAEDEIRYQVNRAEGVTDSTNSRNF